jgi:DNA replication licensing factor MCM2
MDDESDAYIKNLGDTQGHKISDWVQMPGPHNEVIRHFKKFLRTFKITTTTIGGTNKPIYREALRRLVQEQKQSIIIDFEHLMAMDEVLAFFLLGAPEQTLKIFHEALTELCFELYPNHRAIEKELFVRVSNCLQNDNIRDLRVEHLNKLIGISGVVTTSTGVLPQLSIIKFNCQKCGFTLGPFTQNQENEIKPGSCPECQSNGPFELNMEEVLI